MKKIIDGGTEIINDETDGQSRKIIRIKLEWISRKLLAFSQTANMFFMLLNAPSPAFSREDCQQIDYNVGLNLCLLFEKDGHNSYHGCQKCMAQGVCNRAKSKMCFSRIFVSQAMRLAELRTHEQFHSLPIPVGYKAEMDKNKYRKKTNDTDEFERCFVNLWKR